MNSARNHFLAYAALSGDQDIRARGRDLGNRRENLADAAAFSDDAG